MTIRDYITKRVRLFMVIAVASWLLFGASVMLGKQQSFPALTLVGFAGFAGAILGTIFFVRCPRCHTMLGQFGMAYSFRWGRRRANFCPFCGANFDERL